MEGRPSPVRGIRMSGAVSESVLCWLDQLRSAAEPYEEHCWSSRSTLSCYQPSDDSDWELAEDFRFLDDYEDEEDEGDEENKEGKEDKEDEEHEEDAENGTSISSDILEWGRGLMTTWESEEDVGYESMKADEKSVADKIKFFNDQTQPVSVVVKRPLKNHPTRPQTMCEGHNRLPANINNNIEKTADMTLNVLKEGPLDRIKHAPDIRGKFEKHWRPAYACLTTNAVFLANSNEDLVRMKSGERDIPVLALDLNGAKVEWTSHASSKKNVFHITAATGAQILVQNDNTDKANSWFDLVEEEARKHENMNTVLHDMTRSQDVGKVVRRAKSFKEPSSTDRKEARKILKKRLDDRQSREDLVKKGIIKDEPVFGSSLAKLQAATGEPVPEFVVRCINILEKKENIESMGLYRTSPNAAHVQKVRLEVNQGRYEHLEAQTDAAVVAGAHKLFFRELVEPLVPYETYQKLAALRDLPEPDRISQTSQVLHESLPESHTETLHLLLRHLCAVSRHEAENKMGVDNISTVWGQTLIRTDMSNLEEAYRCTEVNDMLSFLLRNHIRLFPD